MSERYRNELVDLIRHTERRLETAGDLDPLLDAIGDASYVLLGEASHGTSEYYTWRARLSQRLISEKGFSFIAVEGDWPDCYQVIGFGAYRGSVIAGAEWGAPMEKMMAPSARPDSWEAVLHEAGAYDKLLLLDELRAEPATMTVRGHRAIGVVYNPQRERGNYVPTILPRRYDAFLYLDETQALHPLHAEPKATKPPETYPWGV